MDDRWHQAIVNRSRELLDGFPVMSCLQSHGMLVSVVSVQSPDMVNSELSVISSSSSVFTCVFAEDDLSWLDSSRHPFERNEC